MSLSGTSQCAGRVLLKVLYIGHGRCNLCGSRVRFLSMTRRLGGTLAEHGFPYSLDDFETLNHRRYVCPVCGSVDRDRLYKLYRLFRKWNAAEGDQNRSAVAVSVS